MQTVGTCHTFRTQQEMIQPSDIAPPLPCDRPHRSETFQMTSVDGQFATYKKRPDPEQIAAYAQGRCYNADAIREYLGAGPRDTVSFSVWPRLPTRAEWAMGVRTLRCDLVPPVQEAKYGPLVAFSFRDVLEKPGSSAVRTCEHGSAFVTCDHPHDREDVALWQGLDQKVRPADAQTAAAQLCRPAVEEFLAAKLASRPDLMIKASAPNKDEWMKGVRTVKCGVGPADPGATIVGTLSASARGQV
ncbi:septum formation family protein (plasmid) [Streptomyces sp. R39]|uniref:Septum formation family protein n=1 Tax=Streptomyces sp. R39 TaxID=3238631 RepID=A0AB39R919_9ACTN